MKKNKANTETLINNNKKFIRSKKVFFASLSVLCASSGLVIANDSTDCGINPFYKDHPLLCAKPELGVDFGFTRTQFKDSADKMFNRNQFPVNFFFGFNVTERFGIEVGYGETRRKHKQVTLEQGDQAPGYNLIGAGQYQVYDTSISISQPYVSLKYTLPINNKLRLFGAAGVTMMKLTASWDYLSNQLGPTNAIARASGSKSFNIRKTIPLIKLGMSYQLNKSFALRFIATYLQTSKLQTYVPAASPAIGFSATTIKQKNIMQYSIGIVYSI